MRRARMRSANRKAGALRNTRRLSFSALAAGAAAVVLVGPAMAVPKDCVTEMNDAKSAITAAQGRVTELEGVLDNALAGQADANEAIGPIAEQLDAARQHLQDAQDAFDAATAAKEKADDDLATAHDTDVAAQSTLSEAESAKAAAESTLEQARQDLADARAAAEAATTAKAKGAAGYFEYRGQTAAASVLTDPNVTQYFSDIHLGAANDATSLDNMLLALQMIEKSNTLRAGAGLGLSPLVVSDTLMAVGMANADRAAVEWGHSGQFGGVGENLAYGYSDPFTGWYYAEKAIVDAAKETGCSTSNNPATVASDCGIAFSRVGHYLNIITDYSYTGFGATQPSGYMSQIFSYGADVRGLNGVTLDLGRTMSVADYRADVQSYKTEIDADIAALPAAQSTFTTAQSALTTAETSLSNAQTSAATAQQALEAAAEAQVLADSNLATAEGELSDAADELATVQAEYDLVPQELKDAKEAADEAVAAAQAALTEAQEALVAAQAHYDALEEECTVDGGTNGGAGSAGGSAAGGAGSSGGLAQTGTTATVALLASISALGLGAALVARQRKAA